MIAIQTFLRVIQFKMILYLDVAHGEVDGQDDGHADDGDDEHEDDEVPLELDVLQSITAALPVL